MGVCRPRLPPQVPPPRLDTIEPEPELLPSLPYTPPNLYPTRGATLTSTPDPSPSANPSMNPPQTPTRYRFDTLFRANRMGNIMHHIMSGPASAGASN